VPFIRSSPSSPLNVLLISPAPLRAGDLVVAVARVQHELLRAADVDVERRRVRAVERDTPGDRRRLDLELFGAAAVHLDGVVAVATLVDVVVVARIPHHRVVARAAERLVARPGGVVVADEAIVAGIARQPVRAIGAVQAVVAVAAVDVEPKRTEPGVGGDGVIAAVRVQVKPL
jgi:hypothetical protein